MSDTDATGETAIWRRLDTLVDAMATANRAAIAHRRELESLRFTIVFGLIFLTALYVKVGR